MVALAIGLAVGLAAAYFGGRVDALIMRIVDIQLSFPAILIALILLAVLGQGVDKVIIALITVQWAYYARTVRGAALVERARNTSRRRTASRCRRARIVFRHLLPNCLPPLIVVATVQVAHAIALEATLSFLGLGLPITEPSLGPADRQRLPVPAVGQLLDQLLSRRRAAADDRQHQSRRRPAARRAESAAAASMTDGDRPRCVEDLRTHFFTKAGVVKAVDDVIFAVARGEILGLVGESGSGKTVTGFSIMGLVDPPGRIVGGQHPASTATSCSDCTDEAMRELRGDAHRDDLPGPDDDAQSGAAHRHADDRGGARASDASAASRRASSRAMRSAASASRRPTSACKPIRTSSPAACASAWRSRSRC